MRQRDRIDAPLRSTIIEIALSVSALCGVLGASLPANAACTTSWADTAHFHEGTGSDETCNGEDHSTGHTEYFDTYAGVDTINAAGSATNYADHIESMGGNDVVDGQAGWDLIYAGEGMDTVRGGYWGDVIHMGESPANWDEALGEDGDDEIHGSYGYDLLRGGPGTDRLYDDCCGGSNEKDRICGGADGGDFGTTEDGDVYDYIYGDVESPRADGGDLVTSLACQI